MKPAGLPLAISTDCQNYLDQRCGQLHETLVVVNKLAERGELPDVSMSNGVLKMTPLSNMEPPEAEALARQTSAMLPRIKITDLLMEVDGWTGFSRHFVHLRDGTMPNDRISLLTAILADAINLGLNRMAEACPGSSLSRLSWIVDWHVRDETYSKALAEIVNYHHRLAFAEHWGEGTTSSSDGQRFQTGGHGQGIGQVNARYGSQPPCSIPTSRISTFLSTPRSSMLPCAMVRTCWMVSSITSRIFVLRSTIPTVLVSPTMSLLCATYWDFDLHHASVT
jgi:hypothetical protein